MDTSEPDPVGGREETKKNLFEDLSREDLIKKCKGLLVIAQKAKHSKQDLQCEVDKYKLQLEKSCQEHKVNQDNLKTLQELVDSLTEQKLNYITELDSSNTKNASLLSKCRDFEKKLEEIKEECLVFEAKIFELNGKVSDLDNENVSLKRQKDRFQDENEELMKQLTELEARVVEFNNLGLEQREQLQLLEDSVNKGSGEGRTQEHQARIDQLSNKIAFLEKDLDEKSIKIKSYEENNVHCEKRLSEAIQQYEKEKERNDKAYLRLKCYREKIMKCGSSITQLKNSKFILLKTVREYSETIPKWQDDIIKISKMLNNQFLQFSAESKILNEQILELQDKLMHANTTNQELNSENQHLVAKQKELTVLTESLQEQKTDVNSNIVESLNLQIRALESEKLILVKEKTTARDCVIDLESQIKNIKAENIFLSSNMDSLKLEINSLRSELKTLQEQLTERDTQGNKVLKEELRILQEQFDAMKKEHDNLNDLNNLLKEEVDTLRSSLEQPNLDTENLSDLNVSLQTDIMKLESKNAAYKQENASLLIEVKESRAKIKELNASNIELQDAKSKLVGYKTENSELLNEMKEINQVLKERGETISKQQKAIAEMEGLIETLEKDRDNAIESKNQLECRLEQLVVKLDTVNKQSSSFDQERDKLNSECKTALQALAEKVSTISKLRDEIEKFKQQPTSNLDQPSEDMSTSTISRAEEHSRMKELDETFEDKYTKLRIFALKLKKRINELTVQLQSAETDKNKLEKMLSESGDKANKSQDYQNDIVALEQKAAEAENLAKENKQLKSKLQELSSQKDENACVVGSYQSETSGNEMEQKLIQQIELLTKDLEVAKNTNVELENLKAELAAKELLLLGEVEQHKATKDILDKARRDVKKKSVLSLEMEDYERSMKDLTNKMEENKKKIVQMESTIDAQQGIIISLKTQIKLLEDQIKSEEHQNRLSKEELQNTSEELKEKESIIQAKNEVITKLEQEIETGKRLYEDLNIEMASLLGEKEKKILGLIQDKTDLSSKLKRVETWNGELDERLKVTNIELEDLKAEFTSYKVRAQAVLRQNQTVDHSQEERVKEELAAVKAHANSLQTQLQTANDQIEELQSALSVERRRAGEAAGEVKRAQQRTTRLHDDLQRLTQQLDSERAQNKLQISTLTQCYKTQISDLESRLESETQQLKKELEAAKESLDKASVANVVNANTEPYLVHVIPKEDSDCELDINVSMLPREEGEGSESAPSPPLSKQYTSGSGNNRSPVPLERLLEEGVPEDESADNSGLGYTQEQELQDAKRKLQAQLQRVKHVTLLLAESERECARLSQLGELLKAEVRRARGTQQAHNLQYMKNVTLKFLTLPAGDERSRLVPVLQKLLTLSNDEAHTLAAVAKGVDPNASRGWGSYLAWPGGK